MAINIKQIKQNYSLFNDCKIEQLASNEIGGLEPEVIPLLIDEIKKRKLDPELLNLIELQIKEVEKKKKLHDCNKKDIELLEAVKRGDIKQAKILLKKPLIGKPANIDLIYDNQSLLHIAVANDSYELIDELLKRGANTSIKNKKSQNPVRVALLKRNSKMLSYFVKYDVDFGAESKSISKSYTNSLGKETKVDRILELAEISFMCIKNFDLADLCLNKAEELATPTHYVELAKYYHTTLNNPDKAYYFLKLTENYLLYYDAYIAIAGAWHDLYKNNDEAIANMERAVSSFYEDIDIHYSIAMSLVAIASAWKRILNDTNNAEHYLLEAEKIVMEKPINNKSIQFTMLSNAWINILENSTGAKRCNQLAEGSKTHSYRSLF